MLYTGTVTDQAGNAVVNARIVHDCFATCGGGEPAAETNEGGIYTLIVPDAPLQPHTISCNKTGYVAIQLTPGTVSRTRPILQNFNLNLRVSGIPDECLDAWYAYRKASRDYRVGKLQPDEPQLFNDADQKLRDLLDALQQQGVQDPNSRVNDVLYYRTTANEIRPRTFNDGYD